MNKNEAHARSTNELSISTMAKEQAPQKSLNTDDYEYTLHLEQERRRNEILMKIESEKEIRELKKKIISTEKKSNPPIISKPVISKDVCKLIKIKPKKGRVES